MNKHIFYFYPGHSTFIQKDLDILAKRYELTVNSFAFKARLQIPIAFIRQFTFILFNIWKADLIICRFVGYSSFLPALFGKFLHKPVLLIAGGTEAHSFPSVNYGNFTRPLSSLFTRWSFKLATHIAPVDESLVICNYLYDDKDFSQQGYQYFCPKTTAPHTTIHNGYDPEQFRPVSSVKRNPNSFITIAGNIDGAEYYIKGIDMVIEAARMFTECSFAIIAEYSSGANLPQNISLIPPVPNEQLPRILSEYEFYLQLSMAEGFPNAICEAMLCGCIPIGSNVFGIPTVMGDCGFVLKKKETEGLKQLISSAKQSDKVKLSANSRQRIVSNFHIEKREKKLLSLLDSLIK